MNINKSWGYIVINRERTKEALGYDFDPEARGRSKELKDIHPTRKKNFYKVIDNCPKCGVERTISFRQSKKNKPCSKCFHNQDRVIDAKRNQSKFVSDESRKKMSDNHWLKNGGKSPFKGKTHTAATKAILSKKSKEQAIREKEKLGEEEYCIRRSIRQRHVARDDFDGFVTEANARERQSSEGKAWKLDVLQKCSFTCDKCNQVGGKLVAHHLNSFNSYPEQRTDINNGICLCESCHNDFHSEFGKGFNTEIQYNKFKKYSKG